MRGQSNIVHQLTEECVASIVLSFLYGVFFQYWKRKVEHKTFHLKPCQYIHMDTALFSKSNAYGTF